MIKLEFVNTGIWYGFANWLCTAVNSDLCYSKKASFQLSATVFCWCTLVSWTLHISKHTEWI